MVEGDAGFVFYAVALCYPRNSEPSLIAQHPDLFAVISKGKANSFRRHPPLLETSSGNFVREKGSTDDDGFELRRHFGAENSH